MGKQIGAKIDPDLWRQIRMLAIQEGTTATELLNQAMRNYIEKHGGTSAPAPGTRTPAPAVPPPTEKQTWARARRKKLLHNEPGRIEK